MDSDLAWVNGESGRQSWRYHADAFQRSIISEAIYHLHGYVPNAFASGIIVPIVKDKSGDLASVENYRPITLSPVIFKIFESVLVLKYGSLPRDAL